jgi:hypothetical protein
MLAAPSVLRHQAAGQHSMARSPGTGPCSSSCHTGACGCAGQTHNPQRGLIYPDIHAFYTQLAIRATYRGVEHVYSNKTGLQARASAQPTTDTDRQVACSAGDWDASLASQCQTHQPCLPSCRKAPTHPPLPDPEEERN